MAGGHLRAQDEDRESEGGRGGGRQKAEAEGRRQKGRQKAEGGRQKAEGRRQRQQNGFFGSTAQKDASRRLDMPNVT
jgi:hypothetical protein